MNKAIIVVALFFLSSGNSIAADPLCEPKQLEPYADNIGLWEEDLTEQAYEDAISYFKDYLPELMEKYPTTEELRLSEGFYIGYVNNLLTIRGYVMKQAALKERANVSLGGGPPGPRQAAFCVFLVTANWVD